MPDQDQLQSTADLPLREFKIDRSMPAAQLMVGLVKTSEGTKVTIGLKHPDGSWIVHQADPQFAREVATTLGAAATLAEEANSGR